MKNKKIRVAVLMGGPSSEHGVSLRTGQKIIQTLDQHKYLIQPVVVTKAREWLLPPLKNFLSPATKNTDTSTSLVPQKENLALRAIKTWGIDVVFIAMHGEFGEDGTVQGLLETIGIPYTGSGVLASALGMDKSRSLAIFRDAGLKVADFFVVKKNEWPKTRDKIVGRAEAEFGLPLVIKPVDRGSSVGITIAKSGEEILSGVKGAFDYSNTVMLQRYTPGTEVTCGVIEIENKAVPLQPTQIIPKERKFFDYFSKYTAGATEEITPPRLPKKVIELIKKTALETHRLLGCSGMSRTDMIFGDDQKLYVLEINTIPGLTETSLLPQAAEAVGISFPKLLDLIIESGLKKR